MSAETVAELPNYSLERGSRHLSGSTGLREEGRKGGAGGRSTVLMGGGEERSENRTGVIHLSYSFSHVDMSLPLPIILRNTPKRKTIELALCLQPVHPQVI